MDILKLAKTRYTTKVYDSSKKIPQDKVEESKQVLQLASNSIDIQVWQFHFVQNSEIKSQLADASYINKDKINQADILVVFSYRTDLEAFQKVVDTYPKGFQDAYSESKKYMTDDEVRNGMTRQLYLAMGFGLSSAIDLGLDSTPMEGINSEEYMKILDIKGCQPLIAVAVGNASKVDYNRLEVMPKLRRPIDEVIFTI